MKTNKNYLQFVLFTFIYYFYVPFVPFVFLLAECRNVLFTSLLFFVFVMWLDKHTQIFNLFVLLFLFFFSFSGKKNPFFASISKNNGNHSPSNANEQNIFIGEEKKTTEWVGRIVITAILVKMFVFHQLWFCSFCDSKSKEFTSFSCLYIWKQCNWIYKREKKNGQLNERDSNYVLNSMHMHVSVVCSLHRIFVSTSWLRTEPHATMDSVRKKWTQSRRIQNSHFEHLMAVTKAKNFP